MTQAIFGAWGTILMIAGATFALWLIFRAACWCGRFLKYNDTLPKPEDDPRNWQREFERWLNR